MQWLVKVNTWVAGYFPVQNTVGSTHTVHRCSNAKWKSIQKSMKCHAAQHVQRNMSRLCNFHFCTVTEIVKGKSQDLRIWQACPFVLSWQLSFSVLTHRHTCACVFTLQQHSKKDTSLPSSFLSKQAHFANVLINSQISCRVLPPESEWCFWGTIPFSVHGHFLWSLSRLYWGLWYFLCAYFLQWHWVFCLWHLLFFSSQWDVSIPAVIFHRHLQLVGEFSWTRQGLVSHWNSRFLLTPIKADKIFFQILIQLFSVLKSRETLSPTESVYQTTCYKIVHLSSLW